MHGRDTPGRQHTMPTAIACANDTLLVVTTPMKPGGADHGETPRRWGRRSALASTTLSEHTHEVCSYRRSSNVEGRCSEHCACAERAWGEWSEANRVVVLGYPTSAEAARFAKHLRTGRVRTGEERERHRLDKRTARNLLVQMEIFLWPELFPAFMELSWAERNQYWAPVHQDHNHSLLSAMQMMTEANRAHPRSSQFQKQLPTPLPSPA